MSNLFPSFVYVIDEIVHHSDQFGDDQDCE